ncbi:hypothetical protein G4Y79_20975 [Phototrophicus methaneseepsis]|uniref:Uncharacterized protein n=1 Tax=Phototrophicus methaneseepsis TaxID=2710758 RepID=A0A7S8E851_9CHLR|nr:hypothetical protein [Phototrophicus methaneseepsis]QPC82131.1 hypothetical protein G4Y79_20975 [Phototrophicus methaneseepsis]
MQPQDAWNAAYHQLELQLDEASFTWLMDAMFQSYEAGIYHIKVRNSYARDMCQHRLYRNIRRILSDVAGEPAELCFHADERISLFNLPEDVAEPEPAPTTEPEQSAWHYFARLPEAVIDELAPAQLGLLAKFIRHTSRKTNTLLGSIEDLSAKFDVPESTFKRHTKELVKAGHLVVIAGRGRGNANTYHLAGQLAIVVCGAEVAAQTTKQAPIQQPVPEPEPPQPPANVPDKVGQFEPASGEKQVNLNQQSDKVGQIEPANTHKVGQFEPASPDKVGQIEPPIQTFKQLPDVYKKQDAHARAYEAIPLLPAIADSFKNKLIQNSPKKSGNQKPARRGPKHPNAMWWAAEFHDDMTEAELSEIKKIDDSDLDPRVVHRAMKDTIQAVRQQSYPGERLRFFRRSLERQQAAIQTG